jgi:hypothetical protein
MTWTKLDDDTVVPDQPLSAFIGKRLTTNVSSYNIQLARLATFVYPLDSDGRAKVKWASAFEPKGTVVTVDCGRFGNTFTFRLFYRTTNADLGGYIQVRDLDSGNIVRVTVPGSATPTVVEIPYLTQGVSGLRGFHIGFVSEASVERVGNLEVNGAVGNQVFCEPAGGNPFPFTLAAGSYTEMYHLLSLSTVTGNPAPAGRALNVYQVCGFKHNTGPNQPPHGVLTVWPEVEANPPRLSTNTSGGVKNASNIFELGRLELYSIAVEMDWPLNDRLLPPYAYQQPTPLNRIDNAIDGAMRSLQPNAATLLSTDGYLGCVLPAGDKASFAFFIQADKSVQQLLVSFRAVAYNQDQDAPDITFSVRDYLGAIIGPDLVLPRVPVPRVTGQTTVESRDNAAVFMNGVLAGDEQWGMRDAMPVQDAMMGLPVRFAWGPNVVTKVKWGKDGATDAVYYGTITATADLYIYGFNCRVQ